MNKNQQTSHLVTKDIFVPRDNTETDSFKVINFSISFHDAFLL